MNGFSTTGRDRIDVLTVDDDRAFSDLVATYLERNGDRFRVRSAQTPRSALSILETHDVDCVVSDFSMSGLDGLEFLERVRELDADLPFILFTGKGSEEIASKAISAGVTDYLQKETGTEQYDILANRIQNAVSQHQANHQMERAFQVLDTAQEGIGLLDDDGAFMYVNDTYCEITGYDRDELVGEHWGTLTSEASATYFREQIRPELEAQNHWHGETTYVRKDDRHVVVDHVLSYTDDGTMVCLVNDAFGHGAHGEPKGGGRLLDEALDAIDDVFYVIDADGELVRTNRRLSEVSGYSTEEIADTELSGLFSPEDTDRIADCLHDVTDGATPQLEASIRTKDGQSIPHQFRTREITDKHGTVIGLVGIGRDVSEQKRRTRRLSHQTDKFESFADVLAHDLRNPLAVATGRVEQAIATDSVEELDAAADALSNLDAVIDSLATVMRDGSIVESTSEVSLANVFEEATNGVAFEDGQLSVDQHLFVDGDSCAVTRMAENLLSNAIEHAGPSPTVSVGATADGFYVEDDGQGIPESERTEIFDTGRTSKSGKGGYGLVSVEQIAMAHGWTVRASEGSDGGARFEFSGVDLTTRDANRDPVDQAT